jgi:hypothetical protein
MHKNFRSEEIWNEDLIEILKEEFKEDFPKIKIIKGKVLKDIFLNKSPKTGNYKIQFGFVDQDIIFYEEEMDISKFYEVENILIHNNSGNKNKMVIPRLICELKYNGVNSHGLITYSDYASDIKSIFPECKYWLVMRYSNSSSDNKLYRHGKYFDKIIFFDSGRSNGKYHKGDFKQQIENHSELKKIFLEFINEIKKTLVDSNAYFIK